MTHSTRWVIAQAIYAPLVAVAAANGATALFNPRLPIDPKGKTSKLLFLLERGDVLIEQPGHQEKRRSRVVLGALVFTEQGDADADELHFAARAALRQARTSISAAGARLMREAQVDPELREPFTEGAVLMSAIEIEYSETYPTA